MYSRAQKATGKGEKARLAEEAIKLQSTVLEEYPDYVEAHVNTARCYVLLNDCRRAISHLEKAYKLNDEYGVTINYLAYSYTACREFSKAIPLAKKMLSKDSTSLDAYKHLGAAYQGLNKYDSSTYYLQVAKRLFPEDKDIDIILNGGRLPGAISEPLGNNNTSLPVKVGRTEQEESIYFIALKLANMKDYRKAGDILAGHLTDAKSYTLMGLILDETGDHKGAIEHYQRAIKLNSSNSVAYFNMGNSFLKQNELKQAEQAYLQALSVNPAYEKACRNLVIVYQKLKDKDKELKFTRKLNAMVKSKAEGG